MKVIYIAGPYRDKRGEWYVVQNIRAAEDAAVFVWQSGGVALCPHKNTALFGGAADDSVWLKGDLELLRRCDAIFLVPGWESSSGTQAEVKFAAQQDIPILETDSELIDFLAED